MSGGVRISRRIAFYFANTLPGITSSQLNNEKSYTNCTSVQMFISHKQKCRTKLTFDTGHYYILENDFEGDPEVSEKCTEFVNVIPRRDTDRDLQCKGNALKYIN